MRYGSLALKSCKLESRRKAIIDLVVGRAAFDGPLGHCFCRKLTRDVAGRVGVECTLAHRTVKGLADDSVRLGDEFVIRLARVDAQVETVMRARDAFVDGLPADLENPFGRLEAQRRVIDGGVEADARLARMRTEGKRQVVARARTRAAHRAPSVPLLIKRLTEEGHVEEAPLAGTEDGVGLGHKRPVDEQLSEPKVRQSRLDVERGAARRDKVVERVVLAAKVGLAAVGEGQVRILVGRGGVGQRHRMRTQPLRRHCICGRRHGARLGPAAVAVDVRAS